MTTVTNHYGSPAYCRLNSHHVLHTLCDTPKPLISKERATLLAVISATRVVCLVASRQAQRVAFPPLVTGFSNRPSGPSTRHNYTYVFTVRDGDLSRRPVLSRRVTGGELQEDWGGGGERKREAVYTKWLEIFCYVRSRLSSSG